MHDGVGTVVLLDADMWKGSGSSKIEFFQCHIGLLINMNAVIASPICRARALCPTEAIVIVRAVCIFDSVTLIEASTIRA